MVGGKENYKFNLGVKGLMVFFFLFCIGPRFQSFRSRFNFTELKTVSGK